jgi:predicted MPP superfamily phosphohydrolase
VGLNILHLSDLHLSDNTNAKDLAAKIHNALLEQHKLSPDSIIVTGDIFDAKCFSSDTYRDSIDKAIAFFGYLSAHLKINNYTEQLFFVPGNHELYRTSPDQLYRYREFLAKIYAEKWNDIVADTYNEEELCFIKHLADKKVILIGLNSPRYENSTETALIGNTQLHAINEKIMTINERDDCRIIVCLHNNIYNTLEYAPAENIDATCVQDNDRLLSTLNNYNCTLILHGHKHQKKDRRINLTQDVNKKDHLCTVVGGGKLANSFNYLEIYDTDNVFDLFCMEFQDETGIFKPSGEFQVPISERKQRFSNMIAEVLQSNPDLNRDYQYLKNTDTNCDSGLIAMFDAILGSFREISDGFLGNMAADLGLLYIVLGTIHYRSNFHVKNGFCDQSEELVKKATDRSGLSDMVMEMLKIEDICGLYDIYEKSKDNPLFGKHRKTLIFLALSIYLSEFFITIKKRPNEFFDSHIQQKANYNLGHEDIKPYINGNTIKFEVNEEHRALEIAVRCITANSHKMVSLIIKEFELVLAKFEEDFASVGFRVYYALPKLTKADIDDKELESYEFDAFISQLIPLLAGRNIYSEPEAFTRELIQNSIDAIKIREKSKNEDGIINTAIALEIKEDNASKLNYFKITDQGTGMNRYILERYLTTIGRSFYTSSDFRKLGIAYSPISKFGIGFLSCFMLGKQVNVQTTHHENTNKTFFLDIPNYDGCFFIETKHNEEKAVPGSSITVWENTDLKQKEKEFNIEKIKQYITKSILNIPFDIMLNDKLFIPKFNYYNMLQKETEKHGLLFFVPLKSNPVISGTDTNNKILIDEEITDHSEHGIYFYKNDKTCYVTRSNIIMNNGILITQSMLPDDELQRIHPYLDAAFNLPSYALELDVSRDKIKSSYNIVHSNVKKYLQVKILRYLATDLAKNIEYILLCFLDNKSFKLSDISISVTGNMLNVKLDKKSPIEEFEIFRKMIEKLDDTMMKQKETIYQKGIFRTFFDESNFDRELDIFHKIQNNRSIKEKGAMLRSLQDDFLIFRFDSGKTNKSLLKSRVDFTTFFISRPNKLIPTLIADSYYEPYKYFPKYETKFDITKILVHSRAIMVMGALKCILSTVYTYSQLTKGLTIPLDESLIG